MNRSEVMPMEPFMKMFEQWPGNEILPLEKLRLKTLTLMGFAIML